MLFFPGAPRHRTFEPSVTVIVLGAGHLDELAGQDLATVSQDLGDAVIGPQAAPEQESSQCSTGAQAGGSQPPSPQLPQRPGTFHAEDRTQDRGGPTEPRVLRRQTAIASGHIPRRSQP